MFNFGDTTTLNVIQEKTISFLGNILGTLRILELKKIEMLGKTGAENPEDPSNKILKMLNMGSIPIQNPEMEIR